MRGSFKMNGTRTAVFALLLGIFAIGTWQTVSAKENQEQNIISSVFSSFTELFAGKQVVTSPTSAINYDQVIGTCDTSGPIEVESTGGVTTPTAYATLKDSFDAINAGTHTGTINVEVCGNTTETASAVLNTSGGTSSYTSVTMRPVGGARIIEGSIVGAIIKLNGADNVTIDGRIGGTGTSRDLTVRNNSTAASTAAVWLASVVTGNGAMGNTVRNLELAAGATQNTSTNSTFGIIMSGTTISTTANGVDNDNNSFIANRVIRARYGIVTRGTTTDLNINPVVTDNIIGPTSFGTDEIGKVGIFMQADTGATVSRNTVQFVGGDFANTTGGADRVGIGIGSESWSASAPGTLTSNNYTVTRNFIHDVVEQRTFSSVGIDLATTGGGSATNNLVANNFIYNIVSNGTSGDQVVGIGIAGGFSDNVVFNSISITGDMDGTGAANSSNYGNAMRIANASGSTHQNLNLKDNSIYMDVNSNTATNPYFAITVNSATYAFGTGGLNYNNYYITQANTQMNTGGITATATAPTAGLTYKTLANWQTALTPPQDQNSIQADPQYVSNTADLHIAMASPNVNAGVAAGGVTTDIDGQLRVAAPDIGADEPAGVTPPMNDIAATAIVNPPSGSTRGAGSPFTPQASYTNNGTNAQTNVTVRFRILDASMVEVYNQTATIASLNSGASTTVSFPDATIASAGNYTTIASVELAGDQNTSNDSVSGTLTIAPPFSGTYNVGTGETYTSLSNTGGIFDQINSLGATGNVVINITSDLTAETGTVALNEVSGGFTVTIKPSGAARVISGSNSTNAIIRINGADGVTIDGSLSGGAVNIVGGNPAIRNLTVQNTSTTATAAAVIAVTEGTNGANNVTIKNVNVSGQDPTQTLLGIQVGGNAIGSSPTNSNNNSRIENCSVQKAILGIFNNGGATPATGTVITQNDLSATGANRLRRGAIFFFSQNGIQVTENSIGGIDTNESADAIGIIAGIQNVTNTVTTGGGISNANISRNKINGVTWTGTVGFSAVGIAIAGDATAANTVANNMITGVTAPATSPDLVAGIFVAGVTGSNTKLYFNSVSMTGDRGTVASQVPGFALAITGTDPNVELKDNIFYTTQTASGGGANAKSYAIGTASTTFANLNSNYNDFWSTGANDGGFRSGSLNAGAGTDYTDLAAWQTATSGDANSQEVDPLFISDLNDLHLQATSPVENDGTPVAGITTDIDGNPRSATTPEIGADELFVAVPGTLQFSSATYSVGEAGPTATLTVSRTGGTDGAVSVDYSLANGTATGGATCGAGVDFVNTGGTVMFADGETSKSFTVAICDDAVFEGDEDFTSTLSNVTNGATIGSPSMATVTITDNDVAMSGSIQFSSPTYSVGEAGLTATITVTRTGGSDGSVSANYATSDGSATGGASCGGAVDYVTTSGTATFGNGVTTPQTFSVPICDDTAVEGNETVNLALSNVTGGATLGTPNTAVLTITDNDMGGDTTINVGTGETITSLTNPGGAFEVINGMTVSGNITVNITSDLTAETGAVALNEFASGFTVTIKPSGAARTVSGTSAASSGLIILNGADNVVIDGSLSGGTDRSLTITNATTTSAVVWIRSTATPNGSNNDTIKNTNLAGSAATNIIAGVLAGSSTFGSAAQAPQSNNTIQNNNVIKVQNALFLSGNATTFDQNWAITGNTFGSTVVAEKLSFRGMLIGGVNNFNISQNTIMGINSSTATTSTMTGIQLSANATNGVVTRNSISNVRHNNPSGFGANGIFLAQTSTASNTLISNNFIWDVTGVGFNGVGQADNGYGIVVSTGAVYKIYFNSINLATNQTTANSITGAVNILSTITLAGAVDMRDNILVNTETVGTRFAVINSSTQAGNVFSTSDYNDFFAQNVGRQGATVLTTLSDWQTATGKDANSQAVDPLFVSATNLHLQPTSPLSNDGSPLAEVTVDIDGDARSATTPDIGADEFAAAAMNGTLQFSSPTYSIGEAGGTATITVTRTNGSAGTVTVNYATSNGTATGGAACTAGVDYINNSGTLTFADGVMSQTFNVVICNDSVAEPNETINYTLTNPTGGATLGTPSTAVQTIVDDDTPTTAFTFTISDAKVVEGNSGTTNAVFTVTLANAPTIGGTIASVQYSTANGTATAGSDYVATSGTLNFTSTGTMTITVPVNGDTVKESNEFFYVNLSNPSSNASITDGQGVGIIIDEDRTYVADYDRDLKTDFSVYRPSNSTFYVSKSTKGFPIFQTLGMTGDISVPGDYDGDGKVDFALWRPATGDWTILRSSDSATQVTHWGASGDKPVQGDYDGDGKTDLAVYRPSEGNWYILPSASGAFYAVQFGISSDKLVQADYDGDFKTDIAVYRDGTWFVLRSSNGSVFIQNWGLAGDKPVIGDFDSDGRNDLTVYRDGTWYIFRSLTNDFVGIGWGITGDIPVAADYDGDGTSDVAVFRPSTGDWYVIRSTSGSTVGFHWGQNGDVPTPSAYIPQ